MRVMVAPRSLVPGGTVLPNLTNHRLLASQDARVEPTGPG